MPGSVPERPARTLVRDDIAYILPIAVFLVFTWAGGRWEQFYPHTYVLKTIVVAAMLVVLWRHYTRIRWDYWWLGAIVGVVGIVQWVGMEKLLQLLFGVDELGYARYHVLSAGPPFVPFDHFETHAAALAFIAIRMAGAVLLVPVMEELFWRDFLWRTIAAPNDFKMIPVGEWDWKAFVIVAVVFGAGVHIEWATAIVYGFLIGALLLYTKSLGACIICHAVTNLLLAGYVLMYQDWTFW